MIRDALHLCFLSVGAAGVPASWGTLGYKYGETLALPTEAREVECQPIYVRYVVYSYYNVTAN